MAFKSAKRIFKAQISVLGRQTCLNSYDLSSKSTQCDFGKFALADLQYKAARLDF